MVGLMYVSNKYTKGGSIFYRVSIYNIFVSEHRTELNDFKNCISNRWERRVKKHTKTFFFTIFLCINDISD
jgi:hypothetical protein